MSDRILRPISTVTGEYYSFVYRAIDTHSLDATRRRLFMYRFAWWILRKETGKQTVRWPSWTDMARASKLHIQVYEYFYLDPKGCERMRTASVCSSVRSLIPKTAHPNFSKFSVLVAWNILFTAATFLDTERICCNQGGSQEHISLISSVSFLVILHSSFSTSSNKNTRLYKFLALFWHVYFLRLAFLHGSIYAHNNILHFKCWVSFLRLLRRQYSVAQ